MMASATGNPRCPARIIDSGVPPTAIQIGSGSWNGLGYTPWIFWMLLGSAIGTVTAGRGDQMKPSLSQIGDAKPSFPRT